MIHHWGNTIAPKAKLFEPFYCAIIYTFLYFFVTGQHAQCVLAT